MKVNLITTIGSPLYIKTEDIQKQFGMKEDAARLRLREFKHEKDRYGEYAYIKDGGFLLINYLAFTDYIANREKLREKNIRKTVEAYDARKVAKAIGWYEEVG